MLGICSDKSGGAENKHLVLLHTESIQAVLGLFPGTTQSVPLSTASLFQLGCPVLGAPPFGWVGTNSLRINALPRGLSQGLAAESPALAMPATAWKDPTEKTTRL